MEFKEILEQSLGERMPKNPQLSALTKRIIVTAKEYQELQKYFTFDAYNMWCAGVNKHTNPNGDPMIPVENYIETGDAKKFSELFITQKNAEIEAEEAAKQAGQDVFVQEEKNK